MTTFILNDKIIKTSYPKGGTLLDFVRQKKLLTGTKIGCREGDCGACTMLIGTIKNDELAYQSMTSCLTPLQNVNRKHILTIDCIGQNGLSPAQSLMVSNNGTQCGFCTPGFVISMTGFTLSDLPVSYKNGIKAIDGNICRCTGYKSIERAVQDLTTLLKDRPKAAKLAWLVEQGHLPKFMLSIKSRLLQLQQEPSFSNRTNGQKTDFYIGGGTDLLVQKPEKIKKNSPVSLFDKDTLKGISISNNVCKIGAAATVTDFENSPDLVAMFPDLERYMKLVSSTPIRNMATIAGNLVNASPIGDMTIYLLALEASITLKEDGNKRTLPLQDFYLGYKKLDKSLKAHIESIQFPLLTKAEQFNFEKVCKRTHLDIASVNSACKLSLKKDGTIALAHLSAGGVGPIPKYLTKASSFLENKPLQVEILKEFFDVVNQEISPISDARGSADYKRLLLRQLLIAHFIKFFGLIPPLKKILSND